MKSDSEIRRDVEAELRWSPDVDQTDVAVKVNDRVVTLTGFMGSYYEKFRAEAAVKRIAGVAGVANDIRVHISQSALREDPEIARAAVAAIRAELPTAAEDIKVLVHQGRVTLEGTVEWDFQRGRAEDAVRGLRGILSVDNAISLKPRVAPTEIKRMIEDAFRRSAEVDADGISVAAVGGEVVLNGRVRTWTEWTQAQQTAWSAPGVTQVKNELRIAP